LCRPCRSTIGRTGPWWDGSRERFMDLQQFDLPIATLPNRDAGPQNWHSLVLIA
jgi:hypothetical protein